jgi:hypothetical protein
MITINQNIPIEYDPEIISKIKEMIKEGFDKLKTFVKTKIDEKTIQTPNFKFYNELDQKFDEISYRLKELKLCDEHNYFLSISDYILYIIRQNSIDSTFGHCNFALELLEFFMELFKTNLEFYDSDIKVSNEFKATQKRFKERYWDYRYIFYSAIYQSSGDFTEEEMYKIHKRLRG